VSINWLSINCPTPQKFLAQKFPPKVEEHFDEEFSDEEPNDEELIDEEFFPEEENGG
jgi:hypothetical protein